MTAPCRLQPSSLLARAAETTKKSFVATLLALACFGCAAEREPLGRQSGAVGTLDEADGEGGEDSAPSGGSHDDILSGPCEGTETRICRGKSPTCIRGVQSCVDGQWSYCRWAGPHPESEGTGSDGGGGDL